MTLILASCSNLPAQDLSGIWKGELKMVGYCFPVNYIELQIIISGSSITGTSYQYPDAENYIKKDITGTYDKTAGSFVVQESGAITYKIPKTCAVCIKRYKLTYSKMGSVETLSGTWSGNVMGTGQVCQPGTIILSRTVESVFKEPPRINVDTGDIRLDFYDNGTIDGDSITVLVNKNVVVSNQKLSAKPITTHVKVDASSPFQLIEMIAENLGSIPPNTALLIITHGERKYRLFLTSTEQKTATVRIVYDAEAAKKLN